VENLVLDLHEVFDFVTSPSLYLLDIDMIAFIKETPAFKKKHRFKSINVHEREWVLINEDISLHEVIPESCLYMDTKKLSEGKEFIYNKQQKYVLLPIRNSDGELI
jgi:hypothetical protein